MRTIFIESYIVSEAGDKVEVIGHDQLGAPYRGLLVQSDALPSDDWTPQDLCAAIEAAEEQEATFRIAERVHAAATALTDLLAAKRVTPETFTQVAADIAALRDGFERSLAQIEAEHAEVVQVIDRTAASQAAAERARLDAEAAQKAALIAAQAEAEAKRVADEKAAKERQAAEAEARQAAQIAAIVDAKVRELVGK